MGRKTTRKFIDRKHDIVHTFKVVLRSQKDPLLVDETAPQGVLVDAETNNKEELHEYGIYFDDNYNYLQHLRGVKEAVDWEQADSEVYTIRNDDLKGDQYTNNSVGLVLPSSAFESCVEEPIGLLNRAAPVTGPRPELDPDLVAELDSDDETVEDCEIIDPDDEDALPDNFVSLLNAEGDLEGEEKAEGEEEFGHIENWLRGTSQREATDSFFDRGAFAGELDDDDDCDSRGGALFSSDDEERDKVGRLEEAAGGRRKRMKAHTVASSRTSASSATVPRSELLTILDEKFDRLYNEEYTEEKIGGLDCEVIEGPLGIDSELFQQAIETTKKQFQRNMFNESGEEQDRDTSIRWLKDTLRVIEEGEEEKDEMMVVEIKPKERAYDCESILSTYSNTQNRPHLIDDRLLFPRKKPRLTARALQRHERDEAQEADCSDKDADEVTLLSCISAISIRPKEESTEDRRDRKGALKELRRERRKEKKQNQLAFKEELKRQKQIAVAQPRSRILAVV